MGNACTSEQLASIKGPDTTNVCSDSVGQQYLLPGFCIRDGGNFSDKYCTVLGSAGEWELGEMGGRCRFYVDKEGYEVPDTLNCSGSAVGLNGVKTYCKRKGFNGSHVKCCFQEYDCYRDFKLCFSDPDQKYTCAPEYRSISSSSCRDTLTDYCLGQDLKPDDPTWISRWIDENGNPVKDGCYTALEKNLFNFPEGRPGSRIENFTSGGASPLKPGPYCLPAAPIRTGTCEPVDVNLYPINASGLEWGKKLMDKVFDKYARQNEILSETYDPFRNFVYLDICCRYPNLCANRLTQLCSSFSSQDLVSSPTAANFCGCYLPPGEYKKYVDRYQINKECTPVCNRPSAIPLVTSTNAKIRCKQDVCLIDNLAIDLAKSQVGDININQICGGCGGGNCTCFIENNNIIGVDAKIGSIRVTQQCGKSVCTRVKPGTNEVSNVSCDERADYFPEVNDQAQNRKNIAIALGIILGIIILVLILFLLL